MFSFRSPSALVALVAFCSPAVAVEALPRFSTPAPYAIALGCSVTYIARANGSHKTLASYAVRVVDTLDHPLGAGTAILYGVSFPDGTTQNATTSLRTPLDAGSSEIVGGLTPAFAPASCSAGIPPAQRYSPPSNGGPGSVPISSSPKPVLHEI